MRIIISAEWSSSHYYNFSSDRQTKGQLHSGLSCSVAGDSESQNYEPVIWWAHKPQGGARSLELEEMKGLEEELYDHRDPKVPSGLDVWYGQWQRTNESKRINRAEVKSLVSNSFSSQRDSFRISGRWWCISIDLSSLGWGLNLFFQLVSRTCLLTLALKAFKAYTRLFFLSAILLPWLLPRSTISFPRTRFIPHLTWRPNWVYSLCFCFSGWIWECVRG